MDDVRTFRPGALGDYNSVRGFAVVGSDGRAGRVTWGSYAPGESYLVVTTGRVRRRHRVVPAGAVEKVDDGKVFVGMSRLQIGKLPLLSHPQAALDDETVQTMLNAFEREASLSVRF